MKIISLGGSSSGATAALDNLASVAINTSLISDTDNTDDLGSSSKQWKVLYAVTGTFTGSVNIGNAGSYGFGANRSKITSSADTVIDFTAASGATGTLFRFGNDAGTMRVGAGVTGAAGSSTTVAAGFQPAQSANGATVQILGISELLTLSTSGTTTDTTANLLPANSFIKTVVSRITTTIATATQWQTGDPTTAGRFTAMNNTMTAGTTDIGIVHRTTGIASATTGMWQAAAAKVRVTTTGTPSAGIVRLTTFYELLTPPTS